MRRKTLADAQGAPSASRSPATSRSCGVVTLKLRGELGTTQTAPPVRSTSHASSVACARTSSGTSRARSSAGRRKACGVWIAHRRERSSVRVTPWSAPASLTVSVTGAAATAASAPASAASVAWTSAGSRSARAASWMATAGAGGAAASARRTDALGVSPPGTVRAPWSGTVCAAAVTAPPATCASGGSATTTSAIPDARTARRDHSSRVRPAQTTNALGRPAPRRSPLPAATTMATASKGVSRLVRREGVLAVEDAVEMRLGLVLGHLERVHQLGGEDLLGAGVHLLLARRQALVLLADREVAHDLGELVDVAGLDLVAVVLEPAVPVLGHLGHVVREHREHLLHRLLVDDPAQARLAGVLARDHDGHVVVQDLDGEVLAHLAEDV